MIDRSKLDAVISSFNEGFAQWGITFPTGESFEPGRVGVISMRGWTIKFLIDHDENGWYIDYYATHRMTNDQHKRLYANCNAKTLPAIETLRPASDDPEMDHRMQAAFDAKQQETMRMLNEKGFGMSGGEHFSLLVQRYEQFGKRLGRDIT